MTELQLPGLSLDDFSTESSREGQSIVLKFLGNGDLRATSALDAHLTQLHKESQRLGIGEVMIDFRNLEFMNSSCFKCFVTWIGRLQEVDSPYKVRFISNLQILWQRRSLQALSCFAIDLITIEA